MTEYLNSEQRGECERLARADPATLCFCGWWDHDGCICGSTGTFTHADRVAAKCPQCGAYPDRPGDKIYHRIGCGVAQEEAWS